MTWLSQLLDSLTSTELAATLVVAIPAVLKLASLVRLDVKRLPSWAQPIPGLVLAVLAAVLEQLQEGKTLKDAFVVIVIGWLGGTGAYHVAKRVPRPKGPPETLRSATVLMVLFVTACTVSFEEARLAGLQARSPTRVATVAPSERCMTLDDEHRWWGGVAKTTAVLAGAEGISTWPVKDPKAETYLAIGAGVTAAVTVGAEYLSEQAGETWARECAP